jgi:hypothetical protein
MQPRQFSGYISSLQCLTMRNWAANDLSTAKESYTPSSDSRKYCVLKVYSERKTSCFVKACYYYNLDKSPVNKPSLHKDGRDSNPGYTYMWVAEDIFNILLAIFIKKENFCNKMQGQIFFNLASRGTTHKKILLTCNLAASCIKYLCNSVYNLCRQLWYSNHVKCPFGFINNSSNNTLVNSSFWHYPWSQLKYEILKITFQRLGFPLSLSLSVSGKSETHGPTLCGPLEKVHVQQ